ncbi:dnaJ homolog subfamily C member 22 isoform X2 [Hippocampus zosterae]|uniref:dnaJ homolog subfamily C member 22 isoform X2 n=1 Tax=Hippocampus zosterae TaxID=109293 RepID=UPI00223CB099|nr:dnaJ homolog subfamily C member 22 isoform X2 [Hippocampus zosterae]
MVKSVMVAYALWAVGGLFGLHHFYLGRDSQTLLWILTLGGFGIGWIRDLICIPTYVTEANAETMKRKASNMLHPPVNPVRFAGQVCVGVYFGTVALIGLSFLRFFDLIVLPLCVAAGVHLVSTVGQQTSHLPKTIIASLITSPIFYGSTLSPLPISLAASVTATQHRKYKKPPAAGSTRELGGYYEEAWTKMLEILLKDYNEQEKEALKVLSLGGQASLEEITRGYRELAKTWHPDHNPSKDSEAMFVKIHEAYEVLLRRHRPRRFT